MVAWNLTFEGAKNFENIWPITDWHMVLDLLYDDRWEHRVSRRLYLRRRNSTPTLEKYMGCNHIRLGFEYRPRDYLVADGVGEYLLSRGLVQGRAHWGYTDDQDLEISDGGRATVRRLYEELGTPYDFERFARRLRTEDWLRSSTS
jgi:hypothetical protein